MIKKSMKLTLNEQKKAQLILEILIQTRRPVSYNEFASSLGLSGPKKINRIVLWLEQITIEDMHAKMPIRACMVFSKHTPCVPSSGFFIFCARIGLYDWQNDYSKALIFIETQQKALYSTK